ncbi:hypothetical protein REPUB_Repub03eG0189700 [Reevesia pubescens]
MEGEITNLWKNLQLTEEEDNGVMLGGGLASDKDQEETKWLVGKIFTSRPFNKDAMISTLKIIWSLAKPKEILVLENNFFLRLGSLMVNLGASTNTYCCLMSMHQI